MKGNVTAFILRFQEIPSGPGSDCAPTGTTTITAVRAEQIDADTDTEDYGVFGGRRPDLGTITGTFVRAEAADEDPGQRGLLAVPRFPNPALGTQTLTEVRAEDADEDPRTRSYLAIAPICCSS
jgi:hypothetical protein